MDPESWRNLKARLLSLGCARLEGVCADDYIARSSAGPGAGGRGAVFFSCDGHRVRLTLEDNAPVIIRHDGVGQVVLTIDGTGTSIPGFLERPALHCPRQAFITISASCVYSCKYCTVPRLAGNRKTPEEIEAMVESVFGDIDAISLTSGVYESIEEEESYTAKVVSHLTRFGLPIGVSIYPTLNTPALMKQAGAVEVKFNLEAATPALFAEMCPGFSGDSLMDILRESVWIFGKGHVFSNVILGLGETDEEMYACLDELCQVGIIPVVRPLNPIADLKNYSRPDMERILKIFRHLKQSLNKYGLDSSLALTMCPACTGCDMIPGRD
jgi:biotin synthase-related radical SAM superfamily protein